MGFLIPIVLMIPVLYAFKILITPSRLQTAILSSHQATHSSPGLITKWQPTPTPT